MKNQNQNIGNEIEIKFEKTKDKNQNLFAPTFPSIELEE